MQWHQPLGLLRRLTVVQAAILQVALLMLAMPLAAQELAPRAYWPAPRGTNVMAAGYQFSTGDVATDATLPIVGVESRINYLQLTWQRTLGLFGRSANLQINVPYTWSTTQGIVEGQFRRREVSALADARLQLSINLRGAPSMDAAEFRELAANPRTIVGASILVQPPTGGYENDRFINAGTNRWSTKVGLGVIWPFRPRWMLETHVGAWFFGDNDEFVSARREQEPIGSVEVHLIRHTQAGFWASLDVNYYVGGQTEVDGVKRNDELRNSRIGFAMLFPLRRRHAIRAGFSTGILTEIGGDFDSYTLNYLYAW
ncbi:MAG: transporter [Woeseiaceae bacterium]|nr:transporter [Woeseiaceae bacterium]